MDLDGTLEDSRLDLLESVNAVRVEMDLNELAPSQIKPNVIKGMEHMYRNCFPELFPGGARNTGEPEHSVMEKIKFAFEADYGKHIAHHTKLYDGIIEALEELYEVATMAIYTNKPEQLSRKLALELGISKYFDFIVGSDTFPESKPSAKPMKQIAEDADYEPGKDAVFMIGDSGGDLEAAKNFNAVSIWCKWGYYDAPPPEIEPHYKADRPAVLPELIRNHVRA